MFLYTTTERKFDADRLVKLLRDNDVHVSAKKMVNLVDLIREVFGIKRPDEYVKNRLKNYQFSVIDKQKYVNFKDCVRILKNSERTTCKNICEQIFEKARSEVPSKIEVIRLYLKFFESADIAYEYNYKFHDDEDNEEHVDFYLPDLNLAFEIDDEYRTNKEIIDDFHKQIYFMKLKKCDFERVNTVDSMASHVEFMGRIMRDTVNNDR
jgi:hypothetical protein